MHAAHKTLTAILNLASFKRGPLRHRENWQVVFDAVNSSTEEGGFTLHMDGLLRLAGKHSQGVLASAVNEQIVASAAADLSLPIETTEGEDPQRNAAQRSRASPIASPSRRSVTRRR